MNSKKILLTIVGIIVLIAGIGAGVFLVQKQQELRKQAAPATNLSLLPASINTEIGQTFNLSVAIDTAANTVTAADIYVTYDPQVVEAQSIDPGSFLPVVLLPAATDNTIGKASITLGSSPTEPKQGTGTLATITFKALTAGTANITFSAQTQAAGVGEQGNVLTGTNPATVVIASAPPTSSPTSSPTSTASPSPTSSATQAPTASPTGSSSPTSSPTSPPVGGAAAPTPTPIKSGSTTKPTSTTKAKGGTVSPSTLPVAGTSWPGAAAAIGGVLILVLGLLLAF